MSESRETTATAVPTPPVGAPEPRRRNGALDVLRVVAAMAVLVYHWTGSDGGVKWAFGAAPTTIYPDVSTVTKYGYLGVSLFFVISGAVIARSAMGRTCTSFLAARAARLLPALVVSSALVTLLVWFSPYSIVQGLSAHELLAGWLLINYPLQMPALSGVYWTLYYEVVFYCLIAATMLFVGRLTAGHLRRFAYVWLFVVIVGTGSFSGLAEAVVIPDYAALFICGMLIGLATDGRSIRAAALPLLVALGMAVSTVGAGPAPKLVVAASIVAVAYASWGPGLRFLDRPSVALAGRMTYPIYLLEGAPSLALLRYLSRHDVPKEVALVLTFAAVVLGAWLVTRFVDPPASRWIRRTLDPAVAEVRADTGNPRRPEVPAAAAHAAPTSASVA